MPAGLATAVLAAWLLLASLAASADTRATPAPLDVVVLVDNSGSMRTAADPAATTRAALTGLADTLPDDTRYALIAFSETPRRLVEFGGSPQAALAGLAWDGQWTDLAAAVERGLYELRTHARPDASQALVIVSDARIDLPQSELVPESTRWLLDSLVADAEADGVTIVALVPAEGNADFRVLQRLTRGTGGRYLLADDGDPAAQAAELGKFLAARATPAAAAQQPAAAATPGVAAPPVTADSARPATPEPPSATSDVPATPPPASVAPAANTWLAIGLPLLLAVIALAAIVLLRRRQVAPTSEYFPDCYLRDLSHATGQARVALRGRINLVTRMEGTREPGVHVIRIDDRHVGRRHAIIEFREHGFWLRDLKSLNGTFVNGQRVGDVVQLKHGNFVRFHEFEFEFRDTVLDNASETGFDPQPTPLRRPGRGR